MPAVTLVFSVSKARARGKNSANEAGPVVGFNALPTGKQVIAGGSPGFNGVASASEAARSCQVADRPADEHGRTKATYSGPHWAEHVPRIILLPAPSGLTGSTTVGVSNTAIATRNVVLRHVSTSGHQERGQQAPNAAKRADGLAHQIRWS